VSRRNAYGPADFASRAWLVRVGIIRLLMGRDRPSHASPTITGRAWNFTAAVDNALEHPVIEDHAFTVEESIGEVVHWGAASKRKRRAIANC